jgi:hypothetical protein
MGAKLMAYHHGDGVVSWFFWCPACSESHSVETAGKDSKPAPGRPRWTKTGTDERPTFHPSLRVFDIPGTTAEKSAKRIWNTQCHLWVREGRIEYCADSPHAMKGTTIDMVDYPEGAA